MECKGRSERDGKVFCACDLIETLWNVKSDEHCENIAACAI